MADNKLYNNLLKAQVEKNVNLHNLEPFHDEAIDETWKYVLGARSLLKPSNFINTINGFNRLKDDYNLFKKNENNKKISNAFYEENRNIENMPQNYTGSRTYRSVLDELGANGENFANVQTPFRPVTFNENNLGHYLFENEEKRLENLFKLKRTYEAPDLIFKGNKDGNLYNYYAKAFKDAKGIKGHLGITRDKNTGNFYQTNFPLRKNNLNKLLKDRQVVYNNLPVQTAPISFDMPVKYIINRFSNKFNPMKENLFNLLKKQN